MGERTTITFQTEETITLHAGFFVIDEICPVCEKPTVMAAPQAIALIANVNERTIFKLIEAGVVHFIEESGIYICMNSLNAIRRCKE